MSPTATYTRQMASQSLLSYRYQVVNDSDAGVDTTPSSLRYELSVDEAGRGCLFGRVYVACVVLPKDSRLFSGATIKDSKKYSSKKKIQEAADYIKTHAHAWSIAYIEHDVIDSVNILQAVMRGMHNAIRATLDKLRDKDGAAFHLGSDCMAVIDGNYFTPYCEYNESLGEFHELPHVTVEQGDGTYLAVAAASVLAKTARDAYIRDLCAQYPSLAEKYGLDTNMGYGTKRHRDGIAAHGITQWHRTSFRPCSHATLCPTVSSSGESSAIEEQTLP